MVGALSAVTGRVGAAGRSAGAAGSAPEEMHALPLFALAAALAEHGVATRLLGARVPADALAAAYRRIGPPALFVWSQSADTGRPGPLTGLPELRPAPRVLVGGPGWPPELPDRVTRAASLTEARDRLVAAAA